MTRGQQAEFHDISGGMYFGEEPKRIPNQGFRLLRNVEYNEKKRLVKSKGYSLAQFVPTGRVRDVQRIYDESNNLEGYLIGEDVLRFVNNIDAVSPTTNNTYSRCRSRLVADNRGWLYYISDDGTGNARILKKWRYLDSGISNIDAGVLPIDMEDDYLVPKTGTVLRVNSYDQPNADSTLYLGPADNLAFKIFTDHMYLKEGREYWTGISFPIKTNTLAGAETVYVYIQPSSGPTLATGSMAVNGATTQVDITFDNPIAFGELTIPYVIVQISPAVGGFAGVGKLTLHRGLPFFIKGEESTGYCTGDGTVYYDREPVVGFHLSATDPAAGNYTYGLCQEDADGTRGSVGETRGIVKTASSIPVMYWNQVYTDLVSDPPHKLVLGRSFVEGGTLYNLTSLTWERLLELIVQTNDTCWAGSETRLLPSQWADQNTDLSLAEPLPTSVESSPSELNPLMDVLVEFYSRLWLLARIEDTSGIIRTFIRYSETDIFDYWDPLNELAIPDNIVELRPLREDVMLAFSKSKTYKITPSGSSFDWLKIADVGIGGTGMSCATYNQIFWFNDFGMFFYDGAQVQRIAKSVANIDLIQALIDDGAVVDVLERAHQIWFSGDALTGITTDPACLVFDFAAEAFLLREIPRRVYSITEAEKELDTPVYIGFSGKVGFRSSDDWQDEGNTIESEIITKRMSAREGSEVSFMHTSLIYAKTENASGFTVYFDNDRGASINKAYAMAGTPVGDIHTNRKESYLTGYWIDITLEHDDNEDFELCGFIVGALPYLEGFLQESEALGRSAQ